ncbi:MAG: glycoside hydrolase family 9 protein [Candidatus Marinimicrobia bacterium]|nr:glycoside hydrolase family 9 protein [Candidatus Neomarinimicrobiota bacterium]
MKPKTFLFVTWVGLLLAGSLNAATIYLRVNQVGYLPDEPKIAIAFSQEDFADKSFEILDEETGKTIWGPEKPGERTAAWGDFTYHYKLDFSGFKTSGKYRIKITESEFVSQLFPIGDDVYGQYHESVITYMQQQRCGYNPFFDEVCHAKDGRTMYGPMPDSTYIDVSGGWHDAGDHLRYLMTSGNSVCRLLFSYRENKGKFQDKVNKLGQSGANGIPDVLDEARWGLDWMLKMHPEPDQLFHQVADDRDHIGFKLPYLDSADYDWGKGQYRTAYYASGKPQGLGNFQNTSTGIANLAGRYAAAMAMAYDIWKNDLKEPLTAEIFKKAGLEVYEIGLKQPGCQEGTPNRAVYRYQEVTWADDMEWGAAELFKITREKKYLADALRFAKEANTFGWMGADTAKHYEMYPFMNMGHYALWEAADKKNQKILVNYYRENIKAVKKRAQENAYGIGIPFIWCSNNLAAAFVTQCLLYEKMTGDRQYHQLMQAHRDWLLGRNPWGCTQIIGIPAYGEYPHHPHTPTTLFTNHLIVGGLNDGPVYATIFNSLKGVQLSQPDKYADFQSGVAVFHDDIWDYSTNEPTLDGSAETHYFLSTFAKQMNF